MSSEHDDEQDQVRKLLGWLLFGALAALAVIGAFLAINASDDDTGTATGPEVETDAGEPEEMATPDLAAIEAAARAAGVADAVATYDGTVVVLTGTAPDEATKAAAASAAGDAAVGFEVRDTVAVVEPVEEGPADIGAALLERGFSADDFEIRGDTVFLFARSSAALTDLGDEFGADIVFVSAEERRRAVLDALRDAGVENPSASFDSTNPIVLRINGQIADESVRAAALEAATGVAFVDSVVDELRLPPEPVVTFAVDNGVVTLTGNVPDEDTRLAVLAEAGRLFGAGNVVDELEVGPVAEGALRLEGQVPASRQDAIQAGLTELATTLGLEFDDQFVYAELSDEQAALQGELDDLLDAIQINFASGSANLPADAAAQLDTLIEPLSAAPAGTIIAVEGHTDDQGDAGSNQTLSESRARSVVDYLVGAGVDESVLRAVGNGESQPIADNETAEGRAANRRIEFNVVV